MVVSNVFRTLTLVSLVISIIFERYSLVTSFSEISFGGSSTKRSEASYGSRKVLLTSNGLTTPEIRNHFARLLRARNNEDPQVVYIPDAAIAEGQSLRELCARRTREFKFAGTVDCVELRSVNRHELALKLARCDAVYVDYGNTFYLMYHIRASGFGELIGPLVDSGLLYVGSSASSICAGETVSIAFWKGWDDPGYGTEWDLKNTPESYEGLRLVPGISFFPHFSGQWRNLVEERRLGLNHKLVTLGDTQAFLDEGVGNRRILGARDDMGNMDL